MWLYFRLAPARRTAFLVFGVIMLAIQVYVFFGPPPSSANAAAAMAIVAYALFAFIIRVLEMPKTPTHA